VKKVLAPRSIDELDFTPHGPVHPSPADWRDHIIYFLLISRFDDGRRHPAYDGSVGNRVRDPIAGSRFQGGTLRGVKRRLPCFRVQNSRGVRYAELNVAFPI
jgi:hypothetical protein